jgi:hypothetical protein
MKKLEDGAVVLNALAGHSRPGLAIVNVAQRSALVVLARCYTYRPEDEGDLDPLRAWSTLQAQRPCQADCVALASSVKTCFEEVPLLQWEPVSLLVSSSRKT